MHTSRFSRLGACVRKFGERSNRLPTATSKQSVLVPKRTLCFGEGAQFGASNETAKVDLLLELDASLAGLLETRALIGHQWRQVEWAICDSRIQRADGFAAAAAAIEADTSRHNPTGADANQNQNQRPNRRVDSGWLGRQWQCKVHWSG